MLDAKELGLGEVRIWTESLDAPAARIASLERLLGPDELARADRFVTSELRRRFVICRGRLRELLAAAIETSPDEIEFRYERWGKPQLVNRANVPIHFNVSHSGDWALIALALSPIGVDLEVPNDRINYKSIVRQVLSEQEQAAWDDLPAKQRDETIRQLWVCKESLLKGLGLGIAEGLRKTTLPLPIPQAVPFSPLSIDSTLQLHIEDDGTCRMNDWIDGDTWRIRLIQPLPGVQAALTTQRAVRDVSIQEPEI